MENLLQIADNFGRRFAYLRLSITDICNFRCSYCLPDGYQKTGCESFLSRDEITRLAAAFYQIRGVENQADGRRANCQA